MDIFLENIISQSINLGVHYVSDIPKYFDYASKVEVYSHFYLKFITFDRYGIVYIISDYELKHKFIPIEKWREAQLRKLI
jgi:hypothetical protein